MSVLVLKPGMLTTVQDRGREGSAALGVSRAGAMDDVSLRIANALVGNEADMAAIEITLIGPRLRFERAATIALTGAECPLRIDGAEAAAWRPVAIDAGAVIEIGATKRGARAYLAVAGGFRVDAVLGSASTDINACLGPFDGHGLKEGNRLEFGVPQSAPRAKRVRWSVDPRPWFDPDSEYPIRLMPGSHFDALDAASRAALFEVEFRIAPDSNRVGFRFDGPRLALSAPIELVSEPVASGTLQLPPGGQAIALMVEAPTIGGYPRIGQIAAVDRQRLAQRRPGDAVRFAAIDLDDAQTRYLERERELARLIETIGERLKS